MKAPSGCFLIAFAGALLGSAVALGLYEHFVAAPRHAGIVAVLAATAAPQPAAAQVDLDRARSQAQQIASELDASVERSVRSSRDALDQQAQDQDKRRIAAEAASSAAMYRTAITEYYMTMGKWPVSNAGAGLPAAAASQGRYVQSIDVGGEGRVIVLLKPPFAAGSRLSFTPSAREDGQVQWDCRAEGDPDLPRYLSACR
ncbi:pilin [Lysobacter fragariae]